MQSKRSIVDGVTCEFCDIKGLIVKHHKFIAILQYSFYLYEKHPGIKVKKN